MARYEHLPIYKAALDLTVHLEKLVAGFSRYHKYTLVTKMSERSRAVLMQVLKANNALIGKDAPVRHAAKRRRMKTLMQEIIFKAGRMIKHAGRWVLGLGANDSAYIVFERLYRQLAPERQTSTA